MTDFLPVILNRPLGRQRYTHAFKHQLVEMSLVPGVSIAAVAQAHGINANLLHKWRWSYRNGEFGAVASASTLTTVQTAAAARPAVTQSGKSTNSSADAKTTGHIELFVNNMRVWVHGAPDSQTLRSVIDALRT
jgi:transposase